MKTLRQRLPIPIFILGFFALLSFAQNSGYGLEFNSFSVVQEKRTCLNLSPSGDLSFPNGFSLSFNLFFPPGLDSNYGYIFRIIGQNDQHLDFLITPDKLTVVNSDDIVLAECPIPEIKKNYSSFFPFKLDLDIRNAILKLVIGNETFSPKVTSLVYFKKVSIIFGKCDYPEFQTSDVPNMIVKDIRINDIKGDALYYWELSKHTNDGVYDELKNRFAKVENPEWLLDEHSHWNKKVTFTALKNPQITYNSDENTIAIADRTGFFIYNTFTDKLSFIKNSSGFVHSDYPNQMIYNPTDSTYYSYCFSKTEGGDVATYNFSKKSWNNNSVKEIYSEYWHHNRFVSRKDDCLYLFGGYGQHTYKNQINEYSFKTRKWDKLQYKGDLISPRYLSGLGVIDDNRLLLFGGYGNNSGQQFLSPRNYYDLYQIHLPDLTVKKIWKIESPENRFVVANSMIADTLNNCFYALCFPQNRYETSCFLAKFSLQKPEYEIVSDSIPFYFNDILSYADLFDNKKTNELFAVTFSSQTTDSTATVSIYSLAYPPVIKSSVYQNVNRITRSNLHILIPVISFFLLLISGTFVYSFLRKKKIEPAIEQPIEIVDGKFKIVNPVDEKNKKQAIFLFGGFQIKDKDGNDITGEFSPMLRQLFLIILLNTLKEGGKGISSLKLDETLWQHKTRDSARNNRSVMTSRLRQLFENVGQMNIESVNSYRVVKLGNDIYCDYREALLLIQTIKKSHNRLKENVMKLLNIISSGELLPDIQAEWIDSFKADFANDLINLLIDVGKRYESDFSLPELVCLADALLVHDVLNDDALKLKCRSLVKMGKNGLAQTAYNSFVKQYSILFGTKYNYSFTDIIS